MCDTEHDTEHEACPTFLCTHFVRTMCGECAYMECNKCTCRDCEAYLPEKHKCRCMLPYNGEDACPYFVPV